MDLPTGTLTFLFTDIEGSTRLMQEMGDRYVQAQVEHHAILREAFKSTAGRELRTEGDSFFCVFESALDACGAAAQAQRGFIERSRHFGCASVFTPARRNWSARSTSASTCTTRRGSRL